MSLGEVSLDEEIKPVHVKTPSVSASAMLSTSNTKSAQAGHTSTLTSALAASIKKQPGGEKSTNGAKGAKGEWSKPETKGGVTWDDGGWDDNPATEHSRGKSAWGDDRHHPNYDEEWEYEDGDEEYGEDQYQEGPSGGWANENDGWDHRQHTTSASQTNTQWTQPPMTSAPSKPQKPAQASWMSWGEEARKLAKVTDAPISSVGSRNVLSPQQQSQTLRSLLNQPHQSYSAQHHVSTDPHAAWGYPSTVRQAWNEPGPSTKPAQQDRQPWYFSSAKAGPSQSERAWYDDAPKDGHNQRTDSAWHTTSAKTDHKKSQKSSQSDRGRTGKKDKKGKDDHAHRRGRGRSPARNSGDAWGDRRGDEWDTRDNWANTDDWNRPEDNWGNDGGGWGAEENDGYKGGNQWGGDTSDWDTGGRQWDDGHKDRGKEWGHDREDDYDYETWDRRVHFTPKSNVSVPLGPTYNMPSKTMAHAYSSLPSNFPRGPVANSMNEYADVRFIESGGAALEHVRLAFFGKARFARDRIHWLFPPDKDERVASLLSWVQKVSYGLAGFGVYILPPIFGGCDGQADMLLPLHSCTNFFRQGNVARCSPMPITGQINW